MVPMLGMFSIWAISQQVTVKAGIYGEVVAASVV